MQTAPPVNVGIGPITVDPVSGQPNDASATFGVPDLTWTSVGGDVAYTMAQTNAVVTIGPLNITFSCTPNPPDAAIGTTSVIGQTTIPPATTGTTSAAKVSGASVSSDTGSTTSTVPVAQSETMARTGYSPAFEILLALMLLDVGYLVWSAARPPNSWPALK